MNLTRREAAVRLVRAASLAAPWAVAAPLGGCSFMRQPSPIAMDTRVDDSACPATLAPALLVWLPGAYMTPQELEREGFVSAVRQRRLACDVVLVDSHLGHVHDGSVMRRLQDEVIGPARQRGYRQVWLAGISLGGFLAMGYALEHPGEIAGIVALAPYVGPPPLLQAIATAGGPAAWRRSTSPGTGIALSNPDATAADRAPNGPISDGRPPPANRQDAERRLWRWLAAPPPDVPPLWLGYGEDDRLAEGHRLLAGVLPPDRVDTARGGHDWPPWRTLWSRWLDRGLLPRTCA